LFDRSKNAAKSEGLGARAQPCGSDTSDLASTFEDHYNHHRPHQARNQLPPNTDEPPTTIHDVTARKLERTSLLGGLINEHQYTT
jgi:hypothetical protein